MQLYAEDALSVSANCLHVALSPEQVERIVEALPPGDEIIGLLYAELREQGKWREPSLA